ncbi:MAG TPA: Trm112 family protein [Phnomibacter sp.]|nr:Trm112 family protein [Phnomibacter sp.]
MRKETIEKLCCPFDKSDLQLKTIATDVETNIIEGFLFCNHCQRVYPIVKGIPIMSPDEYREFKLEQSILNRWTESKVADNFRLTRNKTEETNSLL